MADLNEWKGVGRLGAEPEVRYMGNGNAVLTLSIACDDSYKSKDTGQKIEQTEWVRCVAFGKTAEYLGEWLRKGARLLACGKLKTRDYEKDGVKRYVTEIHLGHGTQILDWPPRDQNQQQTSQQRTGQTSQQSRPAPQQAAPQPAPEQFYDDDIPF